MWVTKRPLVVKLMFTIGKSGLIVYQSLNWEILQLNGEDLEVAYDQLIYKPPYSPIEVLWHQDAGYGPWPEEAVERGITCWLALVDATPEQGSMQFIPGSHQQGIYLHHSAQDRNPIGGALEVRLEDQVAVPVSYQAGDCSFHHACTLHYTGPNQTNKERRSFSTHFWPIPAIDQR